MSTGTGDEKDGGPRPPDSTSQLPLLTQFLQAARRQRTPDQLGQDPPQGRGRRAAGPKKKVAGKKVAGVKQEDMAKALGVSKATYQRMESGGEHKWTEPQVQAVAEALDLDPMQRERFYVMTLGHYPKREPRTSWDSDTHLLDFVRSIPVQETRGKYGVILSHLTYATDPDFNIVGHNPGFEVLFKDRKVPDNVLKWGLKGGNGQLLEYGKYLQNEALLRVEVMRGRLSDDDSSVQEFDALIRSLPPSDPTSARPPRGLQEDIFRFKPPTFEAGWIRAIEFHLTGGTLGVPDGRKLFSLTFCEGPLEALDSVRAKNLAEG
ncbi:helix-turn-helix transcriptional regulator [Streptomyces sp. NBC_00838]|uniref:helix-turn-helix domain-containing protein n=1 Tax=Streptomyces sp. NBC_00838 TaxID=2903680 RepID=UPI00386E650E|nr:helix-turn-helix transcriptional regulator [Streptomyces sp. NBC_00838]